DANNVVSMPGHTEDFAEGRLVGKQTFLDALADDGDVAGKGHVFVVKVAAITERERISGQKTSIRSDNCETWRRLDAIVNGLAFQVAPEALQANLRRVSLHELVIARRLLTAAVDADLVFFAYPGSRRG